MVNKISKNQIGLTLGIFFALVHAIWSLIVLSGISKPLIDFVLQMHFLNIIYLVSSFSWMGAVILVAATFIIGYIVGWVFAGIFNWVAKRCK